VATLGVEFAGVLADRPSVEVGRRLVAILVGDVYPMATEFPYETKPITGANGRCVDETFIVKDEDRPMYDNFVGRCWILRRLRSSDAAR